MTNKKDCLRNNIDNYTGPPNNIVTKLLDYYTLTGGFYNSSVKQSRARAIFVALQMLLI